MKTEATKQRIDLISLDPKQGVATELSQIEDLITKKVDLIVMIPVDQKTSQTAAKLVNQAGIPLVLLNTKFTDDFLSSGGKFAAFVSRQTSMRARLKASYLVDKLPDGGSVVYLVGEYGGSSTERRKAGFESVIMDHPNLQIVTELQGRGSRTEGKAIMEKLLGKYGKGQLQALVAQNDEMAIGASSAIQAANRLGKFKILIGVDGSEPALTPGEPGVTGTVFQDAIGQGAQAVRAANEINSPGNR